MKQTEIYIAPPREQGFGWTVECDAEGCGSFGEAMLSHEGARSIAWAHYDAHKSAIAIVTGAEA